MVRWLVAGVLVVLAGGGYLWELHKRPKYQKGDRVRITTRVWVGEGSREVAGIWVDVPSSLDIESGDLLELIGTINERNGLENVDFRRVARGSVIVRSLGQMRKEMLARWQRWLPGDAGAIAGGIVLGGQTGLSRQAKDRFVQTGMTHILAASGYNLTLLVIWLSGAKRWVAGRQYLMAFITFCIVCYVFLAGSSTAVWRSAIMSAGVVIGGYLGRRTSGLWWLTLAGLTMWIVEPLVIEDIGFQLSFAAMTGLITWGERATWAAILFTIPIVWHHFGQISLVAPVANLALLWTVPVVMEIGVIASLVGWLWEIGGRLIGYLAWPVLEVLLAGVNLLAGLPGASWQMAKLPWLGVGGYYLCLGVWLWRRNGKLH